MTEPTDRLQRHLDDSARIDNLNVSREAAILHLLTRSDLPLQLQTGLAMLLETMPELVRLLDEHDGWARMHARRFASK